MKRKNNNTAVSVAVRARRVRVADLMLRGMTSVAETAAILGVTSMTISRDQREINERWMRTDIKTARLRRTLRIKQLEWSAYEDAVAWERSKKNAEEITTEYIPIACPACNGTGMKDGNEEGTEWCDTCNGDGKLLKEKVTKRTKGQSGDSKHMANFQSAIKEISRLEGHYPPTGSFKRDASRFPAESKQQLNQTINFLNAPPELILAAKAAIFKLKQLSGPAPDIVDEDDNKGERRMDDE
jgi:hypothetical protein